MPQERQHEALPGLGFEPAVALTTRPLSSHAFHLHCCAWSPWNVKQLGGPGAGCAQITNVCPAQKGIVGPWVSWLAYYCCSQFSSTGLVLMQRLLARRGPQLFRNSTELSSTLKVQPHTKVMPFSVVYCVVYVRAYNRAKAAAATFWSFCCSILFVCYV